MELLLVLPVIWLVGWGAVCAWHAGEKGRNRLSWFVLGFFFGIVALIVLGLAPSRLQPAITYQSIRASTEPIVARSGSTKVCPRCAESIQRTAVLCPFCGHELPKPVGGSGSRDDRNRSSQPEPQIPLGRWMVAASVSDYIRPGSTASVYVDAFVVAVVGSAVTFAIPLKEAVADVEDEHLRLSKATDRQFELLPADEQDLAQVLASIRGRQDPTQRVDAGLGATAATASGPPAPDSAAPATSSPGAPRPASTPSDPIEARLATLERLRSSGAITAEEYTARRAKILDEI